MVGPLKGLVSLLGRVLLCAIFLMAAIGNNIPNFDATVKVMKDRGVPQAQYALIGAIVFLIVGGVSVIAGYTARFGAFLLLVFLALATYYFHNFWDLTGQERQEQMIHFMKNVALMGAMLVIIANGSGAWSLDARRPRP
jgi:putative oxidoreductase